MDTTNSTSSTRRLRSNRVIRPARLLRAAAVLSLLFVAAVAVLLANVAGVSVGGPMAGVAILVVETAAVTLLLLRRSSLWVWPAFFMGWKLQAVFWAWASRTGFPVHFEYAPHIDRLIGLGELPTHRLQQLMVPGQPGLQDGFLAFVYLSFFVAPFFALVALSRGHSEIAGRFTVTFFLMNAAAILVFFVAPTAPPWMVAEHGFIEPVHRGMVDLLRGTNGELTSQAYAVGELNQTSAMPSLHMATTTLAAIAACTAAPWLRPVMALYVVAMGLSLVYMGEHWVVDVLAGMAFAFVSWRLTFGLLGAIQGRFTPAWNATMPALNTGQRGESLL